MHVIASEAGKVDRTGQGGSVAVVAMFTQSVADEVCGNVVEGIEFRPEIRRTLYLGLVGKEKLQHLCELVFGWRFAMASEIDEVA